jgi:hypothetical protein
VHSFTSQLFFQMLGYINAQKTFFHQGHDLYVDLDPYLKSTNVQVSAVTSHMTRSFE